MRASPSRSYGGSSSVRSPARRLVSSSINHLQSPAARLALASTETIELSRNDAAVCLQRWWRRCRDPNRRRVVELSDRLRTHAASLTRRKREALVRAKIRDIALHVVFLVVYTVSCHYGYSSEHLYRLVHATTRAYQAPTVNGTNAFDAIATPQDLYAWLRGPFLSATYPSAWLSPSSPQTDHPQLTNRVVGAVRIGQLRVKRGNCTFRVATYAPAAWADDANTTHDVTCYGTSSLGEFSIDDEATETFGLGPWSFPFEGLNGTNTTTERIHILSSMKASNTKSLPAPAFSVLLPRASKSQAIEILQNLEQNAYVDLQTRAVVVDVNLFNAMLRYTLAVRFLVEFPSAGGAIPTLHVRTAPLAKSFLIRDFDVWWTLCNVSVVAFYAYFLFSEITPYTSRRRKAVQSSSQRWGGRALRGTSRNGSILRALSLVLYFTVWMLRLFTLLRAPTTLPLFASNQYVQLRPFAETYRLSQCVLGLNTCLCWWILVLLLRVVTHVDVLVRTVEFAARRLVTLLLCLTALLYGYASAFLVVVGAESSAFRSIPQAMATLLLLLFGSSSGATTSQYSTVETLLFACFLLLNVFIISNLFLVVVHDAYRQALDHTDSQHNSDDQFNLPLETFKYCRASVEQLVERLASFFEHLVPARIRPVGRRLKGISAVHAVSNSQVVTISSKMIAGRASALTRLGGKLVQNVAAGLGEGDRDRDTTNSESGLRRRRVANGGTRSNDPTTKLLQGMMLQLAIQNEELQRTVDELRRELRQQSLGGGRLVGGASSVSPLRARTLALTRPDSDNDDDTADEDGAGDGDDVQVVDTPTEFTSVQAM
jgi:hypothetical protein